MDTDQFFDVNQRLRRQGLPRTRMYREAENRRPTMQRSQRLTRGLLAEIQEEAGVRNLSEFARRDEASRRMIARLAAAGMSWDFGLSPPRAEPDQVVRARPRDAEGSFFCGTLRGRDCHRGHAQDRRREYPRRTQRTHAGRQHLSDGSHG